MMKTLNCSEYRIRYVSDNASKFLQNLIGETIEMQDFFIKPQEFINWVREKLKENYRINDERARYLTEKMFSGSFIGIMEISTFKLYYIDGNLSIWNIGYTRSDEEAIKEGVDVFLEYHVDTQNFEGILDTIEAKKYLSEREAYICSLIEELKNGCNSDG